MNSKRKALSQKGFTLVELLIVIVIIGILAGVVIGVLNPIQQQNRARDASLRAQLDKMALSNKSLFASSPRSSNRSPTPREFAGGIANITTSNGGQYCADTAVASNNDPTATVTCYFQLTGVGAPAGADPIACAAAGGWQGNGSEACNFVYYRTPTVFRVGVKGWATPAALFVYSYTEDAATGAVVEGFYSCPVTFAISDALPGACTQTNL